jgi:hypothetical protein
LHRVNNWVEKLPVSNLIQQKKLIRYLDKNSVTTILEQLAFYKKAHKTDQAYQFWQEGVHTEWC